MQEILQRNGIYCTLSDDEEEEEEILGGKAFFHRRDGTVTHSEGRAFPDLC